jgi:hypothetical protein
MGFKNYPTKSFLPTTMLRIDESGASRCTLDLLFNSVRPTRSLGTPSSLAIVFLLRLPTFFFSLHHYLVPRDLIIDHMLLIPLPVFICPI